MLAIRCYARFFLRKKIFTPSYRSLPPHSSLPIHDPSLQAATLLTLNKDASLGAAQKIGYEWSHVTYFPALLYVPVPHVR